MRDIQKELLDSLRTARHDIDLGTTISAEMYSNSNGNKKRKLNKNTFQQSTGLADPAFVNVGAKAPFLTPRPAEPGVETTRDTGETKEIVSMEPRYGRRLNWQQDKIVEMHLQISHIKEGNRYSRVKAYISIKTENDPRYMIFMRSKLTTATDETFRSIRKDCDKVLESEAKEIYSNHYKDDLFMGRVKYKPTKGTKVLKHHRVNLPLSLLSMWVENGEIRAKFYLLDRDYDFVLTTDDMSKSQTQYYSAQGVWSDNETTLSIEEAFGG